MATYTKNINLVKPDPSDKATPDAFNTNADILDSQIADLNRYKEMIQDVSNTSADVAATVVTMGDTVDGLNTRTTAIEGQLGDVSTLLDTINGETV